MWCPPPATEENMAALAKDNYTLTGVTVDGDPESSKSSALSQLDIAKKYGLKALLFSPLLTPQSLDDPAKKTQLDELVDAVKKHSALEGYHLIDEPSASAFPDWGKLVRYLKQRDPGHLAYINLFPTYASKEQLGVELTGKPNKLFGYPKNLAGIGPDNPTVELYNEHLAQFITQVKPEIISYDHYHFFRDGEDGEQYFLNLALIRIAAMKAGVPFLNIVQACTIEPSWRLVNASEMRWLAFMTLAYGGKALSWFLHWGPVEFGGMYQNGVRMPHADYAAAINKDIKAIGQVLMKLESTAVYHTVPLPLGTQALPTDCPVKIAEGEFVIGLFKDKGVQNSFVIVNRDYKNSASADLTLNFGKGKLWRFSRLNGQWSKLQDLAGNDVVSVRLEPGDGELFKFTK